MHKAIYDTIGKTYDSTRRADPAITKKIIDLLRPESNKIYLDICCGTANYTHALFSHGVNIQGIDLSLEMLNKAKDKFPQLTLYQGDAQGLPFNDRYFHGATCILATHHIDDYGKALKEAYRVIKKGFFVIFTATPQQMKHYWLNHYFPKMMADAAHKMKCYEEHDYYLKQAGFTNISLSPFYITNQLQDWFLYAGKYRPAIYLDTGVRQGISSFHLSAKMN